MWKKIIKLFMMLELASGCMCAASSMSPNGAPSLLRTQTERPEWPEVVRSACSRVPEVMKSTCPRVHSSGRGAEVGVVAFLLVRCPLLTLLFFSFPLWIVNSVLGQLLRCVEALNYSTAL